MRKAKGKSKFLMNKSLSMNQELTALNSSFSHPINQEDEYDSQDGQKQPIKRQVGIFEQFKIKYDELRKENDEKRKQIDEIKRVSKRFQIQLLNVNTQFYDNQIKRLRQEIEKQQNQSEDYKFKYFETQNKRKELESSLEINGQQLKKLIKQLEAEKVQNVQLKHHMKQKQKQYLAIISTVQQSGNKTAEKYTQSQRKLNQSQNQLRQLKRTLQNQKLKEQKLEKRIKQTQEQNKKTVEKYQIQIKNINACLEQSQNKCREYRIQITKHKEQNVELAAQIQKNKSLFDFQYHRSLQKISHFRSNIILEIQAKRLKQENCILKENLASKAVEFNNLQKILKKTVEQKNLQKKQLQQKVIDAKNKRVAIEKQYEAINLNLKKQIQVLRIQNIKASTLEQSINHKPSNKNAINNENIDQVINAKQKQIIQLKIHLHAKIEEIYKIKQEIEQIELKNQAFKNQIQILEKKISVQQNNFKNNQDYQMTQIKSDAQSLKRKLQIAETKINIKSKEIKQKDSFITNSLIGRIQKQQDISLIMAEIQRVFEGDYISKLADAQVKIKLLESKIQDHQIKSR